MAPILGSVPCRGNKLKEAPITQAHGRFCSRHPIPSLLTICVASCLLLYPAIDLYLWSTKPHQLVSSGSTRPASFFGSLGTHRTGYADLGTPWDGIPGLEVCEDVKCWERCPRAAGDLAQTRAGVAGKEGISLFRALVTTAETEAANNGFVGMMEAEHGALDRRSLHTTHRLSEHLLSLLDQRGVCGATADDQCATLGPLSLWNNDEGSLLGDEEIERTIDQALRSGPASIAFDSLFAGRHIAGSHLHRADYLSLGFPIPSQSVSGGSDAFVTWTDALRNATQAFGSVAVPTHTTAPRKLLIRFRNIASPISVEPSTSQTQAGYETPTFLLAYFIVGMYVYLTLRKLDKVHSRTGLVFTGLVEIALSGFLSVSVCALWGVEVNLVPWKLLPFVVAVLGVDNMLLLANAVVSTSIDLPVSERIAQGLSSVGFSITVSLLAEISAISVIRCIISESQPLVRELCIFSIVALIVEYFLELTFFLTVFSIDMQRLELADLLRQEGSKPGKGFENLPRRKLGKTAMHPPNALVTTFGAAFKSILDGIKARAARVATFNVLFAVFFGLWIMRPPERYLPDFCADLAGPNRGVSGPSDTAMELGMTAGKGLWDTLNRDGLTILPVLLYDPVVVTLGPAFPLPSQSALASMPVFLAFKWLLKVVVLPVSTTTALLYFVLVFLLRNADKLEAQRDRSLSTGSSVMGAPLPELKEPVKVGLEMRASNGVHASDVELLASNGTATVSMSSTDDHLAFLALNPAHGFTSTQKVPLPVSAIGTVCAIAIDDTSSICALGCSDGSVWLVTVPVGPQIQLSDGEGSLSSWPVRELTFHAGGPGSPLGNSPPPTKAIPDQRLLFVTYADGSLAVSTRTSTSQEPLIPVIAASREVRRTWLFTPDSGNSTCVAAPVFCRLLAAGVVEVWRTWGVPCGFWTLGALCELALSGGVVSVVEPLRTDLRGARRELLVVGTTAGEVLAFDLLTGLRIGSLARVGGSVRQLGSAPLAKSASPTADGCHVLVSTQSFVRVVRLSSTPSESAFMQGDKAIPSGLAQIHRSLSASYRSSPRARRVSAMRSSEDNGSGSSGAFEVPSFGVSHLPLTGDGSGEGDNPNAEWGVVFSPDGTPVPSRPPSPKYSESAVSNQTQDPVLLAVYGEVIGDDVRLDGRGGWGVVSGSTGSLVVGVRKRLVRNSHPSEGGLLALWEAWELDLSFTRPRLAQTGLATIMQASKEQSSSASASLFRGACSSGKRTGRDNQTLLDLVRQGRSAVSGRKVKAQLREDALLPFTRIGPVSVPSGGGGGGGKTLVFGLGNGVGMLSRKRSFGAGMYQPTVSIPPPPPPRSRSGSTVTRASGGTRTPPNGTRTPPNGRITPPRERTPPMAMTAMERKSL